MDKSLKGLPTVFVITINWNGLADTLECLRSLTNVDFAQLRTIVVDNGSVDDQAETIAREFPDAVVLRQDRNLGFCGGCNAGIQYAIENDADYVLLLNNDALATPSLVQKLVNAYSEFPDAGAVSPVVCGYPDTDRVWYARPRWIASKAEFVLKESNDTLDSFLSTKPFAVDFATGCCMLVPTKVYEEAGLLDERYFAYYDELDWCFRIRRSGYKSYVVPNAVVYHKETRSTPGPTHYYLIYRNRMLWMKENMSIWDRSKSFKVLAKGALWHLLNNFGLVTSATPKNCSRAVLCAYRDYFLGRFNGWEDKI